MDPLADLLTDLLADRLTDPPTIDRRDAGCTLGAGPGGLACVQSARHEGDLEAQALKTCLQSLRKRMGRGVPDASVHERARHSNPNSGESAVNAPARPPVTHLQPI